MHKPSSRSKARETRTVDWTGWPGKSPAARLRYRGWMAEPLDPNAELLPRAIGSSKACADGITACRNRISLHRRHLQRFYARLAEPLDVIHVILVSLLLLLQSPFPTLCQLTTETRRARRVLKCWSLRVLGASVVNTRLTTLRVGSRDSYGRHSSFSCSSL